MTRRAFPGRRVVAALLVAGLATVAAAADIGQIKVAKGQVTIERGGQALPATVGMRVQPADMVKTGADGSVGITMSDNSLLSAGPNSVLVARPLRVRRDDQPGPLRRLAAPQARWRWSPAASPSSRPTR